MRLIMGPLNEMYLYQTPSQNFYKQLFVFMQIFLIRDLEVIWSDEAYDNYHIFWDISRSFNQLFFSNCWLNVGEKKPSCCPHEGQKHHRKHSLLGTDCLCSLCMCVLCSGWPLLSTLFLQLQLCLSNNPNNFTFRNVEWKQFIMSSTHSIGHLDVSETENELSSWFGLFISVISAHHSTGLVFYASFHTNHNIYIMVV